MSSVLNDLNLVFESFSTKIQEKITFINNTFKDQSKLVEKNFRVEELNEKILNELNQARQNILTDQVTKRNQELNAVNEINYSNINMKAKLNKLAILKFKNYIFESNDTSDMKLFIRNVFKFVNIFDYSEFKKFQIFLDRSKNDDRTLVSLKTACETGDVRTLKLLIKDGSNINAKNNSHDKSLLMCAKKA